MTPPALDTDASTTQDFFDSFCIRPHVSCRNALQKARARFRLKLVYARIVQERKTAPLNYPAREQTWRPARAKPQSPGKRALSRFGHGARSSGGDFYSTSGSRLHRP